MASISSEHNGLRLTFVIAIFLAALATVFSPVLEKITHPSEKMTQVVNLKPGIDMVGGTSLVYEIKKPENTKLKAGSGTTKPKPDTALLSPSRLRPP